MAGHDFLNNDNVKLIIIKQRPFCPPFLPVITPRDKERKQALIKYIIKKL
jgi:hypothetical protein